MEKANRLYYLPLFLSVPIAKKVYNNDALTIMFDGHINHSPKEIEKMVDDVIESGERHGFKMTCLKSLQKSVAELAK